MWRIGIFFQKPGVDRPGILLERLVNRQFIDRIDGLLIIVILVLQPDFLKFHFGPGGILSRLMRIDKIHQQFFLRIRPRELLHFCHELLIVADNGISLYALKNKIPGNTQNQERQYCHHCHGELFFRL